MLSIPHMIVVFVIVLVVFGPQKLPELARGLGKLMAEFRKASTDFKSAFEEEMRDLERQAREVERRKAEAASAAASAAVETQPATTKTAWKQRRQISFLPSNAKSSGCSTLRGCEPATCQSASTLPKPVLARCSESRRKI